MVSDEAPDPDAVQTAGANEHPRLVVKLSDGPIDLDRLWQDIADDDAGAHNVFVGRTRRTTAGKVTERLSYEAFRPMAESEMRTLLLEAARDYQLSASVLVHRLGEVAVGEASIAVAVSSPHRRNAFEAVAWIMDQVKTRVPVWKQERFSDGTTEWVHPRGQADD